MASLLGPLLLLASIVVAQDECSLTPIYVDFHDRRVDGGISVQYGLFTGVGTPSQNLSQWPSLSNNETTVAGLDYCTSSPLENCNNISHGFYEPELSTDFRSASTYQTLDANLGDIPATLAEYAIDTFNLFVHYFDPSPAANVSVPDVPLTVLSNYSSSASPWFGPAGLFGLGPSSTVLTRLKDLGLITTRSYGLYMGTYYQEASGLINGSLTLGGYDSGRFEGEVHRFSIGVPNLNANNSPFSITVSQMTLTEDDGKTTDLLTEDFEAYLITDQYEINLPRAVLDNFAHETHAEAADSRYRLPDGFNSSLTVVLSSGLNLTFEPEWLKNVSNNSPISTRPSDADNSSTTSASPALLGSAFFTHIYMMVNYDALPEPAFYLASARPHGPYVMTRTICSDTQPTPAAPTNISSFAASGMAGAIVGGVVGGIGLTFLVWWAIRKYSQRRMWANRRRAALKGKSVEGGNMPTGPGAAMFAKSTGSPSSFGSSEGYDHVKNGSNSDLDERNRADSAEMTDFAFAFNDGVPTGYVRDMDSNSANSPSSVVSSGYAMVGRELTPSVVHVQHQTHTAQSQRGSFYDYREQTTQVPDVSAFGTGQPLVDTSSQGGQYPPFPVSPQSQFEDSFVSPISPPPTTEVHSFPRQADPPQRLNLPPIQTEFAAPPGRGAGAPKGTV